MVTTAQNPSVKIGYKQTEIGLIPEDWEIITFENLRDKGDRWSITGGPFGSNLKASDYVSDGVRIIQLQNIGDGIFHDHYKIYTTETKAKELLSCNIYPGDIILSKMGDPVARACIIPENENRYLMASDGIRLVVDKKDFVSKFVHDYLNSPYFRSRAFDASTGSTRMRIGLGDLKKLLVIKPPKSEQQAIATALSDVDILIASLDKLIVKKRDIKHATMQQLLTGKTRLPGFSGEWTVKKLEEIAEIDSDNLSSSTSPDYSFKYISLEDVDVGVLKSYSEINFRGAPSRAKRKVKKNDILISTVRPNLQSHLHVIDDTPDLVCSTGFSVVRCYQAIADSSYVYFHLFAEQIGHQIEALLTGSNYPAINSNDVRSLHIPFPSLSEQQAIATVLSDMDAEIVALEQRRDKTRALKQGMMQELLTGKTRLL